MGRQLTTTAAILLTCLILLTSSFPLPEFGGSSTNASFSLANPALDEIPGLGDGNPLTCMDDAHNPLVLTRECMTAALKHPRDSTIRPFRSSDTLATQEGACKVSVVVLGQQDMTSWQDIQLAFTQVMMGCALVNDPSPTLITGGIMRVGRLGLIQIKVGYSSREGEARPSNGTVGAADSRAVSNVS